MAQSSFPRDGRTVDSHALLPPQEKRIIILIHFVLTRLISSLILSLLRVEDDEDEGVTAGQTYRWITNDQQLHNVRPCYPVYSIFIR